MTQPAEPHLTPVDFQLFVWLQATLPRTDPTPSRSRFSRFGPWALNVMAGLTPGHLPYGEDVRLWLLLIAREANRDGGDTVDLTEAIHLGRWTGDPYDSLHRLRSTNFQIFVQPGAAGPTNDVFQLEDERTLSDDPRVLRLTLSPTFHMAATNYSFSADVNVINAADRTPLSLDVYTWLSMLAATKKPVGAIHWTVLNRLFGHYALTEDVKTVDGPYRQMMQDTFDQMTPHFPGLSIEFTPTVLIFRSHETEGAPAIPRHL